MDNQAKKFWVVVTLTNGMKLEHAISAYNAIQAEYFAGLYWDKTQMPVRQVRAITEVR